jgi:hypothetical protein
MTTRSPRQRVAEDDLWLEQTINTYIDDDCCDDETAKVWFKAIFELQSF